LINDRLKELPLAVFGCSGIKDSHGSVTPAIK
jgi:hypothetical protein